MNRKPRYASSKGLFSNGFYEFFDEVLAHRTYDPLNQQSQKQQNLQMDRAAAKRARKAAKLPGASNATQTS